MKKSSMFNVQCSMFGFTLIELLVVVTIMAILGGLITGVFFQALKGATKAEQLKEVRQNGDYILNVMEKMFRNAEQIENMAVTCDGGGKNSISIKNQDGEVTTFTCSGDGDTRKIASSGAMLLSTDVRVSSPCESFIKCQKSENAPPGITIEFTLSQVSTATKPEEQVSIPFKTTIFLRNY